jgi:hypothetical protein
VRGRLLSIVLIAATAAVAVPAYGDESVQFTLGRVIHSTPDARGRIGIRSSCAEAGGCKVNYTIKRGTAVLGGMQALLLANTVQTDYVTLSKATAASLRKRRMQVTITADASDPDGNKVTLTKSVTLGPPKKRR